jgi:hypothetical protein
MDITAPKEWYAFLDVLEKERGIAILLGATDTGKSTFAKFLIFNLCHLGLLSAQSHRFNGIPAANPGGAEHVACQFTKKRVTTSPLIEETEDNGPWHKGLAR